MQQRLFAYSTTLRDAIFTTRHENDFHLDMGSVLPHSRVSMSKVIRNRRVALAINENSFSTLCTESVWTWQIRKQKPKCHDYRIGPP